MEDDVKINFFAKMEPDEMAMALVSENYNYRKIASYILDEFIEGKDIPFSSLEQRHVFAYNVAKKLVLEENFTLKEVLDGEANLNITKHINYHIMKLNSVVDENNSLEERVLMTRREKGKKNRSQLIAFLLSISALAGIMTVRYKEAPENKIDENIGLIASYGYDNEDIPHQNEERIGYDYQKNEAVWAYNYENIANDIINVCIANPNLFDVTIRSTYMNMIESNRLYNMDLVLYYVQERMKNDEAFGSIYEKIANCPSFLNYVLNCSLTSEFVTDEVKAAVKHYDSLGRSSGTFYNMPDEEQQVINDFMKSYRELKIADEEAYDLHNLAQNIEKGR